MKNLPCIVMQTMKHILLPRFLAILVFMSNSIWAFTQDSDIKYLEEKDIVRFNCTIKGDQIMVHFKNIPEHLLNAPLIFENISGSGSGGTIIKELHPAPMAIELSSVAHWNDSFRVYFRNTNGIKYKPVVIYYFVENMSFSPLSNTVVMGDKTVILNCLHFTNPIELGGDDQMLFYLDSYYLNWKTGKIKSGKKLINSGRYENCELVEFLEIQPENNYFDINGKLHHGWELIKLKRIETNQWKREVFVSDN